MPPSRQNVQLSLKDETNNTTDDGTDSLFEESDDDTDVEEWLFDDEGRHPLEHYLSEAANLDVGRLRQKRYSPRTQRQLDWVREHCVQYENIQII